MSRKNQRRGLMVLLSVMIICLLPFRRAHGQEIFTWLNSPTEVHIAAEGCNANSITIQWTDNSIDEEEFRIYQVINGEGFQFTGIVVPGFGISK